jgi:hypothetical protein
MPGRVLGYGEDERAVRRGALAGIDDRRDGGVQAGHLAAWCDRGGRQAGKVASQVVRLWTRHAGPPVAHR